MIAVPMLHMMLLLKLIFIKLFPSATVKTLNENVTMDMLQLGMEVLTLNQDGELVYSPVIAFLDEDAEDEIESKYTTIETEDGTKPTITCSLVPHP
jgi:hypothetical protein